jgi:uncharacterized RDD family membrane protein YckC
MPARFWARYAAWSLDAACVLPGVLLLGAGPLRAAFQQLLSSWHTLSAVLEKLLGAALAQGQTQAPTALALGWMSDPHLLAGIQQLESALFDLLLIPPALYALLACAWTLGFEASSWQATPGKRALGLWVARTDGEAMTYGRALKRFLAAGLSWLTLNFGHAMAAFAPHLALHDRISHTRVLATHASLPGWAKLWLAAQITGGLLGILWLYQWLQTAMQAALNAAMGGL